MDVEKKENENLVLIQQLNEKIDEIFTSLMECVNNYDQNQSKKFVFIDEKLTENA